MMSPPQFASLWDFMNRIEIKRYYEIGIFTQAFIDIMGAHGAANELSGEQRDDAKAHVKEVKQHAELLGMKRTITSCDHAILHISDANPQQIRTLLQCLRASIWDDMREIFAGYIPAEKSPYYENENIFGEAVIKKLPTTIRNNLQESATCYSLNRNTACVYHLMLAMEFCVQIFGKKLNVKLTEIHPGKKVQELGWQDILNAINPKLKALSQTTQTTPKIRLSFLHVRLFFGQLNVKFAKDILISERMGWVPTLKIGPLLFTWRKYRNV